MSRNPNAPAQNDDVYEEEYVINSVAPHYGLVSKFGCLSNHFNQSHSASGAANLTKANKYRLSDNARKQNANHSLNRISNSDVNLPTMDAKTIDNLDKIDSSQETANIIERWRNIVKPGIYRLANDKWKKYHEPKFLRSERRVTEEKLLEIIRRLESPAVEIRNRQQQQANYFPDWQFKETRNYQGGFVPPEDNNADTSLACPTSHTPDETPMEEGEISSDSEMAPSVLEVPTINWAHYLGVKSVQYIKMGHAPRIQALEPNNWDHENTVRETEKKFATDLQLLMTETTNDPKLLETLVCLERKQYDSISEEYNQYKRKLSTRYVVVFFEEKIIVPTNLRTTVITLLHKGHPAINKMTMAAKHFWWPKITEAIQRKCDSCIPCKLSGKNLKPDIPRTEQNRLPPLSSPNEEIQLDFIGPITEENRRLYILLNMDRYSKWLAASLCKSTDGKTAVNFLQQFIQLNGIPKTIRTDKASAFTGHCFREFCKKNYISSVYGTPYIHTPTGLVKRGVRTLKGNLLTNMNAGEPFVKALDLGLGVIRTTPHTRLKKSAFELHFGREPNTELSNMLNLKEIKKLTNNNSVLAKSETLQVHTFSGEGGSSDQLPTKQKRKSTKTVSKYPFQFFERKNTKSKFESPFSDQLQTAVKGTDHTVTTADNKIIHRKLISKPNTPFEQEPSNRGTGPTGPDGRFARKEDRTPATPPLPEPFQSKEQQWDTSPEPPSNRKYGTVGRGKPKLITNREQPASTEKQPGTDKNKTMGPLTMNAEQMSESGKEKNISDTQQSGQELHIKDIDGKVFNTIDSDLDLASNLSASTEIDKGTENLQETNVRRSKRLTKTNPVNRLNNPVNQSDDRKRRKTTKPVTTTGDIRRNAGAGQRGEPIISS